jgi:hypothetical protein
MVGRNEHSLGWLRTTDTVPLKAKHLPWKKSTGVQCGQEIFFEVSETIFENNMDDNDGDIAKSWHGRQTSQPPCCSQINGTARASSAS